MLLDIDYDADGTPRVTDVASLIRGVPGSPLADAPYVWEANWSPGGLLAFSVGSRDVGFDLWIMDPALPSWRST